MEFELQMHLAGAWHKAATLSLAQDGFGHRGPSILAYDFDYFANFGAVSFASGAPLAGLQALSVRHPLTLETLSAPHWPAFLLDLMPQGHARRKLAEHLGLKALDRASDLPLLLRSAAGGIGNIRIKEAAEAERDRLAGIPLQGVSEEDILARSDRFIEVADHYAILASGSSGLQGEWPKVAMTQARDGLYYPDGVVDDRDATRHVIIKLVRSADPTDELILKGEAGYSVLAKELGLHVDEPSQHAEGVLIIPRFDRKKDHAGQVARLGQESLVSALGISEFGYVGSHEDYIDIVRAHSSSPFEDIAEYIKRDIANLALGNPDNHGRNSALTKHIDGTIRLSPLFDFAPMRLSREGIVRSTKWAVMRPHNRDHLPDWKAIVSHVFSENDDQMRLANEVCLFSERLKESHNLARQIGLPKEIRERAMTRCEEIADAVLASLSMF